MNPQEYLDLARELVRRDDASEAARRSSTSRAYYAAFNELARDIEREVGALPKSGVHDHLIRWLRNSGVSGSDVVAESLADLRDRRVEADYRFDEPAATVTTTRFHVARAQALMREFRELPRPALYEGMRDYRRRIGQA